MDSASSRDDVEDGEEVAEDHHGRDACRRVEYLGEGCDKLVGLSAQVVKGVVEACKVSLVSYCRCVHG